MTTTLVLTLIGRDQIGLVRVVATAIAEHGGNWLESRMCRLGGEFAGIVRLEIAAEQADGLAAALRGLAGLRVDVTREAAGAGANDERVMAALDLVGSDRPGILREVSAVLAAHGLNVEDLASERVEAPMGGGKLFKLRALASAPAGVELARVRDALESLATDLMVELKLGLLTNSVSPSQKALRGSDYLHTADVDLVGTGRWPASVSVALAECNFSIPLD
jgi:glycine cleavage system regulatory protein